MKKWEKLILNGDETADNIVSELIGKGYKLSDWIIDISTRLNSELKNEYGDYIITKKLIKDGRKNKVLKKIKKFKIPTTLLHGNKDRMVPIKYSIKTLRLFESKYKKLIIIKNGDHSLSRKSDLKKICKELSNMIFNHI